MNKYIIAIVLCCSITSCIKDEAQNQECDIESAWIEGQEYEKNFYQIAEMRKDNISSAETNITFTVRSLISLPTQIPVKFKITDGATIEPANGSMQDFKALSPIPSPQRTANGSVHTKLRSRSQCYPRASSRSRMLIR